MIRLSKACTKLTGTDGREKQSGCDVCNEFCVWTNVNSEVGSVLNRRQRRVLLRWLDRLGRRIVVFTDFIDDLQLGAKLLITPETNVVTTL